MVQFSTSHNQRALNREQYFPANLRITSNYTEQYGESARRELHMADVHLFTATGRIPQ